MQLDFITKRAAKEQRERFLQALQTAEKILKSNSSSINTLIRVVAASLEAKGAISVVVSDLHAARPGYDFDNLFFNDLKPVLADGTLACDLIRYVDDTYQLRLGRDPILAAPWHKDRFIDAVALIGEGKKCGPWKAEMNHRVSMILPFGLSFVYGGNHSLTAGIFNAEGVVETCEARDISSLYDHVKYDGVSFLRIHDGKVLSTPVDEEAGILFEIGRLMISYGVKYDAPTSREPGIEPDSLE